MVQEVTFLVFTGHFDHYVISHTGRYEFSMVVWPVTKGYATEQS